jgi:pSer/pThr/pTyr-binding forkhead associated (FHA) protein
MVLTPAAQSVQAGTLILTITAGPHANYSVSFAAGAVLIGRETDCTLCLYADPAISRRHAEIAFIGSGWVIRDLGSTNGTSVNGAGCRSRMLNVGDQVSIGQTVLRIDGT